MKSFSTLVACAIVSTLVAAPSSAVTVFSQPSIIPATGPHAAFSSRLLTDVNDSEEAIAYDDFILPAGSHTLNGISWEGEYSEAFLPDPAVRGEADFLIQIWEHDVNQPDLTGPLHAFTLDGGFAGMSDAAIPTTSLGHVSAADLPDVPGGGGAFHYEGTLTSNRPSWWDPILVVNSSVANFSKCGCGSNLDVAPW